MFIAYFIGFCTFTFVFSNVIFVIKQEKIIAYLERRISHQDSELKE